MNRKALKDAIGYFDDLLQYKFPYLDIPSLSIAASYKSKPIYARSLGDADVASKRSASTETPYRVASNSKMFTATAILQLQEAGKLRLDDAVQTFVPWLKKHADTRWHQVTIRQLLSHSAGVSRDSSRAGYWALQYPFPTTAEIKKVILEDALIYDPNVSMKYSNYGFSLLGLVIEKASGLSYNEYVKKNIIDRAGLRHTAPEYSSDIDTLAIGYTGKNRDGRRLPIDHVMTGGLSPATGFVSTPSDMCRFLDALHDKTKGLLSIQSLREMSRIHSKARYGQGMKQFYGLGLEMGDINGNWVVGHGGGFPGQVTLSLHLPDDALSISVVANARDIGVGSIAKSLLATILWFNQNYIEHPEHDLTRFTVRTGTMWGETDLIGYGNSLISMYAGFPLDFENAERLERIDEKTVRVVNTNSFAGPGETMRYHFNKDGSVNYIDDQGTTVLPAQRRDQEWQKLSRISLESPS